MSETLIEPSVPRRRRVARIDEAALEANLAAAIEREFDATPRVLRSLRKLVATEINDRAWRGDAPLSREASNRVEILCAELAEILAK